MRGVVPAHKLLHRGVNCSLSTNNVLNPFTPFGDCSLVRMANIYANICQVGTRPTTARVLRHDHRALGAADEPRKDYGSRSASRPTWSCSTRQRRRKRSPSWRRCCTHSSAVGRR